MIVVCYFNIRGEFMKLKKINQCRTINEIANTISIVQYDKMLAWILSLWFLSPIFMMQQVFWSHGEMRWILLSLL